MTVSKEMKFLIVYFSCSPCALFFLFFLFFLLFVFFPYSLFLHSLIHHSILRLILHDYLYVILLLHSLLCLFSSLFFVFHSDETILFAFFTLTFDLSIYKENLMINCLIQVHSLFSDYLIVSTSCSFSQFDLWFYFENSHFLPDLPPHL